PRPRPTTSAYRSTARSSLTPTATDLETARPCRAGMEMTKQIKVPVSFEFFPTKTDAGHEKLIAAAHVLAEQKPEFFSVTYGAGGSTRDRTLNTVLQLDQQVKIPTAPHLSCV